VTCLLLDQLLAADPHHAEKVVINMKQSATQQLTMTVSLNTGDTVLNGTGAAFVASCALSAYILLPLLLVMIAIGHEMLYRRPHISSCLSVLDPDYVLTQNESKTRFFGARNQLSLDAL